ncbi:hypothetical protein PV328_012457 [Microctonus aethiopoides]|uniref:Uncharacterized protein n=1 Tax=Microctonus aethiopoides TaxID=144406 RepID=A0AA39KNB8_9HYME|nr:hypothetical protein PV328_012457 [Microctonus aethiopoides]
MFSRLPNNSIRAFIQEHKRQVKICQKYQNCYIVGSYKKCDANCEPAVQTIIFDRNEGQPNVRLYYRLLKNDLLYISERYNKSLQTDSSFAAYSIAGIIQFAKILYFVKITQCGCITDKCLCEGKHLAIIRPIVVIQNFSFPIANDEIRIPHIYHCTLLQELASIPVESLITVCFATNHDGKLYLAQRININESE